MNVDSAIISFIGSFFPLFSAPQMGLLLNIEAKYRDREYRNNEEDKSVQSVKPWSFSAYVWFLITRPGNNTCIYANYGPGSRKFDVTNGEKMKLVSQHNSCWQDGIRSVLSTVENAGRDVYYELDDFLPWYAIDENVSFSAFQRPCFVCLKDPVRVGEDGSEYNAAHGVWHLQVDTELTSMQALAGGEGE